jgi:hypothetical protein
MVMEMENTTVLWRYNRTTGLWDFCRRCAAQSAQQWLGVWRKDEPGETFRLAKHRPNGRPRQTGAHADT